MPFCPDCGLCFASVNSVRMHRASGNCVPATAARKPNVAVSAALYGRGRYALPVNGVPATEQELDQLLALQNAQQEAELAKREKMLLDQQINLVLPARQAQLQQGQEALKEQVMQLKLNMLTQEQMKAQGSNLEMEYLHNELNAVQEALRQIRVPAPPAQPAPTGAYHHPHALPQKGGGGRKNEEQTASSSAVRSRHQSPRTGKAQTPPPPTNAAHDRRSRRHDHHGSRNRKGQAANERKGFSKGRHSRRANRRGRNDEEDDDSVSHSSGSASSSEEYDNDEDDEVRHNGADSTSWSSTSTSEDEEDSSSLSGSDAERPYRKGRNHKANRRQRTRRGKRDSIGLTSQTARLPLRPAATAAAVLNGRKSHTANDTGSRHHNNALTPRAAPPLRPSAGYAEKDANYEENRRLDKKYTKALQKLPKPLRHVVQSLRDEVAELRASQLPSAREDSPPFPTSSSLPAGQYKLNLASLSGLDLTVPLEDIELSVKLYYMVNRAGAFMLDPMHEHTFGRQPPPLTRQSSTLLLFTTAPIEFTVTNDEDLMIAVLQLRYRGQLLYWATVFTRQSGAWTEPLRPPPFDLANALQSPDDVELYLPYVMGGTIEPDKRDLLAQAEEYMHEAGLENALISRVLRGLPPLPPLPPGMTLLPGMPGNEGPFLPPQPNAILYGNSNNHVNSAPGAMTTASGTTAAALPHFTLPPPQGMTIVQWNALLRQHLERGASTGTTTPQRRQSSSTSAVPGSAQAMSVAPVTPSVLKPPTPQSATLNPLPIARKASVTPAVTQKEAPKQTPVTATVTAVQPAVVSRMSEAPRPVTTTTATATTAPSPAAQPPCPATTTTTQQQSAAPPSQPQASNKPVSPSVTVVPSSTERRPTVTTSPTPTPAPGPRSTPETQSAAAAALPVKTATMSATPEPQQQAATAAQAERKASLSPAPSQPTSRPTTPHKTTNEAQAASPKRPASARQSTVQIQEQQQRGGQTSSPPLPQAPGGSLMVAPNARMQQHPTSPGSLLRPSSARQNATQPNGQRQGQMPSPPPPTGTSSAGPAMAAAAARRQSMQQPQPQQDTSPGAPNRQPQGQQQQQQQPAGSGEAGAGKVPLVDRPLVAQMQLRPILDNTGSLAVPRGYKDAKNPPSCILLDRFDVSSNVSISVQLGLSKPTDTRPQPLTFAGHGPDKRDVDVFFDGVVGVPLDADCVRLLVYCLNGVDPATGKPVHVLPDPHSLMRKPDLIAYQDFSSSTASPKFTAQLSTKIDQNTCALVIVEYCVAEKENPLVLGHVCLPIHQKAAVGNYAVRLRLGDPRRSHERDPRETRPAERLSEEQRKAMEQYDQAQLEASVNAQALRNLLPAPPMKRAECVPAGFLIWRLESGEESAPYFDLPDQLPLSQQELAIMKARSAHNGTPPSVRSIGNVKEAEESFVGRSMPVGDGLSTLVPYSPERGIFVRVEGVSGVGDAAAFYAVVVHARKVPASASNTRPVQIASVPDWMSDVGAPRFKDPPFVFAGVPYDPTATVVFTLLRLRLQMTPGKQVPLPPVHVEHVGWTITKLFLATPNTARQGCFALPWLAGRPSPELLAEVDQKLLDTVYVTALKSKAIQFVAPRATLRISQGDPACAAALVDVLPGKPQTRPILIPNATRREFPIYTNEGMVGCTLQHAHEYCTGKGDPNAFVKALRDAVQNYLQKEM